MKGNLFEKAFVSWGKKNFEADAKFRATPENSPISYPDAYSDGLHFNWSKLKSVRYEGSVWWELKARDKNLHNEFKYTATKTGAAFLALVTTSNSGVNADVYTYAKLQGVAVQHWQARYRMNGNSMEVDFGYKNSPVTLVVFQPNWTPVKL